MILGNLLKEPISGKDVIIVEKNSLTGILDDFILNNIDNILTGKWLEVEDEKIYDYHFKLIPFSSLGNDNGLLIGFEPDYIKLFWEKEYYKEDIVIAIYNGKLSKTRLYTSLIGLSILEEGKSNEFIKLT